MTLFCKQAPSKGAAVFVSWGGGCSFKATTE